MSTQLDFTGLSVGEAQRACVSSLKESGLDEPVIESRVLVGFVLGGGPERVLADRDNTLTTDQASLLADLLSQRCHWVPMAHIVGMREFWSLPFKVTPATLVPRPDSETIVEAALDHAPPLPERILDLGTGTGCLLLAVLSEWPDATGVGVDASADALNVAQENAQSLNLSGRVRMVHADWTQPNWVDALDGPFDVVISNPPYIPTRDIEDLESEVKNHDPMSALDGGASGLDAYRILTGAMPDLLRPGGIVVFEVGIGQASDVAKMLTENGLDVLEQRTDLGGILRAVVGRKPAV